METYEQAENIYSAAYKKKRDKNDLFHFLCFMGLTFVWAGLLYLSDRIMIDRIISDAAKILIVLIGYYYTRFFISTELSKDGRVLSMFKKVLFLTLIVIISLAVPFITTNSFTTAVEWFTLMAFPSLFGAFKGFTKNYMMTMQERKEHALFVEDLKRSASKIPD